VVLWVVLVCTLGLALGMTAHILRRRA